MAEKQAAKEAVRNPVHSTPTFAEAAIRVIEFRRPIWSNPKHAAQWENTLATYAFPVIGEMAVDEITPAHVLEVLEPIWTVKNETAARVKQRTGAVMDWAVQHGYCLYNSDMTLTALLHRLGIAAVPHGFRSSFTDWTDEQWPEYSEAADKALAHEERSKTRRAYKRTDLFNRRIGLMRKWADYVTGKGSNLGD